MIASLIYNMGIIQETRSKIHNVIYSRNLPVKIKIKQQKRTQKKGEGFTDPLHFLEVARVDISILLSCTREIFQQPKVIPEPASVT